MDSSTLVHLAEKLKIASEHILREYHEMAILQAFSETNLTDKMIFYGGTALRLVYKGPRFSEDLDFLMIKPIKPIELKKILTRLTNNEPHLNLVEVKDKRNTLFALVKITHPSLKHARHIKVEISKRGNGIGHEYRLLYSECSALTPLIRSITLPALEKLKKNAIRERKEPRDWFDLWVIQNQLHKPLNAETPFPFNPKEFKRELKRFLPKGLWKVLDQIINQTT